jgi:hypothetical protein
LFIDRKDIMKILKKGTVLTCVNCGNECYELLNDIWDGVKFVKENFSPLNNMPHPKDTTKGECNKCGELWYRTSNGITNLHTKEGWVWS